MFYKSGLPDIGGSPGELLSGTVTNQVLCYLSLFTLTGSSYLDMMEHDVNQHSGKQKSVIIAFQG